MLRRTLVLATLLLVACKDKPAPEAPAPAVSSATAAAAPKAGSAEPVTFTRRPLAVGMKRQESNDMTMKMSLSVDPGTGQPMLTNMTMTEGTKETRELLAVTGDVPTKVKATFDKVEQRATEDGRDQARPSRIAGKTYVVEAKDGSLEITGADGKLANKAEAAEVQKHFRSLGKVDPLASALPKEPVRPGDKVPSIAKSLQQFMEQGSDGMSISDVDVTYKEKQGDEGVFALALKMKKEDAQMALNIALTGEMRISTTTGEPTKLEITGPLTVGPSASGKGPKMKIDGSGSMTLKMLTTAL
jgi:hypothetical protein